MEKLLDNLIKRIEAMDRSIEAMDTMIKQNIAKVTDVYRYHNETESLWQLDSPHSGAIINIGHISISGWVLIVQSPARTIEIVCDGIVLEQAPVHIDRPDVAEVHPQQGADHSGFSTVVALTKTQSEVELHIRAALADGSFFPMEVIRLQPAYDIIHHLGTDLGDGERIDNSPAHIWQSIITAIQPLPAENISDRHQQLYELEQIIQKKERLLKEMNEFLKHRPVHEFFQQV
jgi:hypothetical protein